MPETKARQQVEGVVKPDGAILCTCGKLMGRASDGQVEFYCRSCQSEVIVSIDMMFHRNCESALAAINRGIDSAAQIVSLMAARRAS